MTVTLDERQAALARSVADHARQGWRVQSQSATQAQLVKGKRPSHLLHFFIGLLTLSLWWIFVWLPISIFGGEKHRLLTVDEQGNVQWT